MILSNLLNVLFPARCPLCRRRSDSHLYNPLCVSCWKEIKRYTGPACSACGIPTASPLTTLCESCIRKPPPFSTTLYFGLYEGALRESIHLFKFGGLRRLSKPLSSLLQGLPLPSVDAIVPVPLHEKNLRRREFNQTARIAHHLSMGQRTPLRLSTLEKVKETPAQTEVSGKERLRNVKGTFSVREDVEGQRLLLLDDVITTGATVRACAEALVDAGAREVVVVALARSVPKYLT